MSNLYVIVFVLNSLSNSQKVVQACHACLERASIDKSRLNECSLVVFGTDDMQYTQDFLRHHGIRFSSFQEPDLDNITTALCTEILTGTQKKIFKNYTSL